MGIRGKDAEKKSFFVDSFRLLAERIQAQLTSCCKEKQDRSSANNKFKVCYNKVRFSIARGFVYRYRIGLLLESKATVVSHGKMAGCIKVRNLMRFRPLYPSLSPRLLKSLIPLTYQATLVVTNSTYLRTSD